MISATTHLRNSQGAFVPLGEADFTPPNPSYVEGAIELDVDGVAILDKTLWDYVDQLWAYIIDALGELRAKGEGSTSFPDQPIDLSFRRIGGGSVLVTLQSRSIQPRRASVDESTLTAALEAAARDALTRLGDLIPQNRPVYEVTLAGLKGAAP